MRNILLSALFFAGQLAWGAPQALKTTGQTTNSFQDTLRVQLPYSQVTKLSDSSMLFETGSDNLVLDPGFERNLTTGANGWTSDGNMNCANTNTLAGGYGLNGVRWLELQLSSGAAGYCNSPSITVPEGLEGQPGELKLRVRGSGGPARTMTVTVYDGAGNVLKTGASFNHTLYNSTVYLDFIFPLAATSTTVYYRITATANTGVMIVGVDDAYVGKAKGVYNGSVYIPWTAYTPSVSVATGTISNYTVTGSEWTRDGENGSYNIYLTFTGSPGTWTQPKFSLPTGQTGVFQNLEALETCTSSAVDVGSGSYDMATVPVSGALGLFYKGTSGIAAGFSNTALFTMASGDKLIIKCRNIKISEWVGSGQNVMSLNTLPNTTNTTCVTPSLVNAGFTTASINSLCYRKDGDRFIGELQFMPNAGSGSGSAFCMNLPSGVLIDTNKVATNTNRSAHGSWNLYDNAGASANTGSGYVTYSSTSQLCFINNISGTFTTSVLQGSNVDMFNARIDIPVVGWSASVVDMPLVRNSVVSNYAGVSGEEYAYITYSAGTPVITAQSGTWITSLTDNGTGNVTLVIPAGIFSSSPLCTITVLNTGNTTSQVGTFNGAATTTAIGVLLRENGTLADMNFNIGCRGNK